jgi:hypothetical protein
MGTLISPHMQEQVEYLDQQATGLLVDMEETFHDYFSQLQNCKHAPAADEPLPIRTESTQPLQVTWDCPVARHFAHIATEHPRCFISTAAE